MTDKIQPRSFIELQTLFLDKTTNEEKITLLRTLNTEEWHSKDDGISFLDWAIQETTHDNFSIYWEQFKTQLTIENVQAIVQSGPNEGTTLLWRLAYKVNENPAAFLCIWEHFKEELTIDDLRFTPQDSSFKNQSLLLLLASNASKAFYTVWDYLKPQFPPKEVLTPPQDDTCEIESILWHLAFAADDYPEAFLSVWEHFKEQITLKDIRAVPQQGKLKGHSILWLLSFAAASEKPEAFLSVFEQFKDELNIEDLRVIAQEDADNDLPLLRLLLNAAENDNPEVFLSVWEHFKDEITIEDLPLFLPKDSQSPLLEFLAFVVDKTPEAFPSVWERFKEHLTVAQINSVIQSGPSAGTSLLWLLAFEVDENPEAFLTVWEHFKTQLTIQDMLNVAQTSTGETQSILWLLTFAARKGSIAGFVNVWEHFKAQITIEHVRFIPQDDEQRSILGNLAYTILNGNPEVFLAVWKQFKTQLTVEDIRATPKGSTRTILWLLASAAVEEAYPDAFLTVWKRFKTQLTVEDICSVIQTGPDKGKSLLWLLSAPRTNVIFLSIWEHFKTQLKVEDFRVAPQTGQNKGESSLWRLAAMASDKPQAFLSVWEHFKDKLTIDDLRVQPENNSFRLSAIGYLALAIGNHNQEAFLAVYEKFKRELKIEDFFIVENDGDGGNFFSELPIFFYLSIQQQNTSQIAKITFDMLTQLPGELNGLLTDTQLNSLKDVLKQDVQAFIDTRNAFCKALKTAHSPETVETTHTEMVDPVQLDKLAKSAFDIGYINAFYDLGNFYQNTGKLTQALECYQLVPKESIHFQHVQKILADAFYDEALASKDDERTENLTHALRCAVNCEPSTGIELIRLIAFSYVKQGKLQGLDQLEVINSSILSLVKSALTYKIDSETLFTQCQGILEEAKASFEQKQALQILKTEIEVLKNKNQNLEYEISTRNALEKTENNENDILSVTPGVFFSLSNRTEIQKTTENPQKMNQHRIAAPAV